MPSPRFAWGFEPAGATCRPRIAAMGDCALVLRISWCRDASCPGDVCRACLEDPRDEIDPFHSCPPCLGRHGWLCHHTTHAEHHLPAIVHRRICGRDLETGYGHRIWLRRVQRERTRRGRARICPCARQRGWTDRASAWHLSRLLLGDLCG